MIKVGIIGNPNAGKTTIFNYLTGSKGKVGNWPGVTVEKKEGIILGTDTQIIDLPGIYSLNTNSEDEVIAKNFLFENPDIIIDIIDGGNLKRNLYLTVQLLELNQNLVIGMNMMDVVEKKFDLFDIDLLSKYLDVPVIPLRGVVGEGISQLKDAIAKNPKRNKEFRVPYGKEIEEHLCKLECLFENSTLDGYTKRMLALGVLEKDDKVMRFVEKNNFSKKIEEHINHLESIFSDDISEVMIERKYGFINGIIKNITRRKTSIEKSLKSTDKIDKFLLHPILGIVIFFAVMFLMFQLTFTIGGFIAGYIDILMGNISSFISSGVISNTYVVSFINNGLLSGLGILLLFLPNLIILFLIISFLEDIGYMARVAHLMDKVMRNFGLQGKAFIPLITGIGCSVAGILSARTMSSRADKITTVMVVPLMSCSARLPIYLLFISVLFPKNIQGLVLFAIYLMGILLAVTMAKVFRTFVFKGDKSTFVMELPPYRIPTFKGMFVHTFERVKDFISRAGTLILAMIILIWVLSTLPLGVDYGSQGSLIGSIGSFFIPIFTPLGFGNYAASAAIISGTVAKEVVITTLSTIYGAGDSHVALTKAISTNWTILSATSFMAFTAIYTPCVAALSAVKKETNSFKWMFVAIGYTLLLAYIIALIVYQGGKLLGFH